MAEGSGAGAAADSPEDRYIWTTATLPGAPTTLTDYTPTVATSLSSSASSILSEQSTAETTTPAGSSTTTAIPTTTVQHTTSLSSTASSPSTSSSNSSSAAAAATASSEPTSSASGDSAPVTTSPPKDENKLVLAIAIGIFAVFLLGVAVWRISVYCRKKLDEEHAIMPDESQRQTQMSWEGAAASRPANSRFSANSSVRRSRVMNMLGHKLNSNWFRPMSVNQVPPGGLMPPHGGWGDKYVQDANGNPVTVMDFGPTDTRDRLNPAGLTYNQQKSAIASSQAMITRDLNPPTFTLTRFDSQMGEASDISTKTLSLSGLSGRSPSPAPTRLITSKGGNSLLQPYASEDLGLDSFQSEVDDGGDTDSEAGKIYFDRNPMQQSHGAGPSGQGWTNGGGYGGDSHDSLPSSIQSSARNTNRFSAWYTKSPWKEELSESGAMPYFPAKLASLKKTVPTGSALERFEPPPGTEGGYAV